MAHREFRDWIKQATKQGWDLRQGGKHEKLYPPPGVNEGRPVPLPGKPTKRGVVNMRAQLRRAGLDI